MANVHRYGFTKLTGGEGSQCSLNVVFIHGLRGHPRRTWEASTGASLSRGATEKSKGFRSLFKGRSARSLSTSTDQTRASPSTLPASTVFWPEQYLASDLPQAQVWTYGYDADIIGGLFQANNKNSISQHGRDLSAKLERDIEDEKPIAFVVHSLGGIIVKDAIRRSETIRDRTKLIIFLGTPHRGSAYAGWGQIASNLARLALQDSNKKLLETLEVNDEVLDNIHDDFKEIASKGTFKVHSFQEARGIAGIKGLDGKVVDDFSSKLDLPRPLETVESINANHMQMVRYCSKEDEGYRAISGILKAFIRQELGSQPRLVTNALDDATPSNPLFMVPFSKDDWFIGREDIITKISKHREASQTHTRIALVGLGGVGKSQIGIEYAYRKQRAEPRTSVCWIHASNAARFQQGCRDIAEKISLPGREDSKADILQLLHAWLSERRNGQWLMILDNVDDDSVFFANDEDTAGSARETHAAEHRKPLESFLPHTPNVTILVTSRNKTAAINLVGGHGDIIQVEPMEEEDALALLQTRVPVGESNRADARALVQALEHIPLAITHAAAYIKTRAPTTTVSTYLKLFRASEANQVNLLSKKEWMDIRRHHSARHAVMTAWQISFIQIQRTKPSAADLLALMSMFDKQGIPTWLLQGNTSQLDFDDALAPLLNFSLVRTEIGKQALDMHRLVQLSMRMWLEAEKELDKWVKESRRILSEAFPNGDYETWPKCEVLLPHAKEVFSYATIDEEDTLNQAKCAFYAGWYLYQRGDYETAVGIIQVSIESGKSVLGPEHPDTLSSVRVLGSVLAGQGKYEEAEALERRELEGTEKVLGSEHPNTLASLNNLGSVLAKQGRYEEAEVMYRRALEGNEKTLGPEHPDTSASAHSLAVLFHRQQRYLAALEWYQRAYSGYVKALGAEHPETAVCLENFDSAIKAYDAANQGRNNM